MGGLYGHRNLDDNLLREWILKWDATIFVDYIKTIENEVDGEFEKFLLGKVEVVKRIASQEWSGKKGFFYDVIHSYMNEEMIYTYFRSNSSTASVANYHEVLLEPADGFTMKSLIQGYEYLQRGGIEIHHQGEVVGHIGGISDLFWHTFYDQYIVQDDYGSIDHARNNEKDFTLQIWDPRLVSSTDELDEIVERIIYDCSVHLGLNFKRAVFDKVATIKGFANDFILELKIPNIERTPLQYFNFANYTLIPRHQYVAYYQVIEFFYIRAMKDAQLSGAKELDIVNYIITKSLDREIILYWFNRSNKRLSYFTEANKSYPSIIPIDINDDTLKTLVNRVYSVRCSLVHSKEAPKDFNFIPNLNDEIIGKEIPLIKFVAMRVMETWSLKS